ncbi:MAG: AEC family transporter [Bacteroidetes bacterium]|nr:AEC family transporter [Bacteroidota bacterium]MCW5894650.1 AEC family transporter [Bacteroidota bacterium]
MNFLLIAFCLTAGWLLQRSRILPKDAHRGINIWILYIALPSVALFYVPAITWTSELIIPVTMPFIVWAGAWAAITLAARRFAIDRMTQSALLLTAGLGNTSFLGFPLTQAYFGEEGLRIAVICDQLSFVVLSTLGVMTAIHASSDGKANITKIAGNVFRFPPFLAFVAAILLPPFVNLQLFNPLFEKLSDTLIPLALFSVGLQVRFSEMKSDARNLALGLASKLILAPALVLLVALLVQAKGVIPQTSVFEAATAPMITSAILAAEYRLNPRLSNLMVSIGVPLSLVTTALWWFVVTRVL